MTKKRICNIITAVKHFCFTAVVVLCGAVNDILKHTLDIRKPTRLKCFDYSANGYYFITVCTENKQKIMCNIVGCGVLDAPKTELSDIGKTVKKQLDFMDDFYNDIKIDKYVIMPNHLHLILKIRRDSGASGTPHPTNNVLSCFVGSFKRFTNRAVGKNIWQKSFYDHIIRDENDYLRICEYIDANPAKWADDEYYT